MIAYQASQTIMPLSLAFYPSCGGMVGWPHWHVIIWERLVVNWILEKVFPSYLNQCFIMVVDNISLVGWCMKGALAMSP